MSDLQKDEFKLKYIPTVNGIITNLQLFPNIEHFLTNLLKDINNEIKHVGPLLLQQNDEKNRFCLPQGVFIDYFIRKYLSNQYNIKITVAHTEHILEKPDNYRIIGENKKLFDSIREHYEIYKDSKTQAMDIIRSIKIVSLSRLIYNDVPIPSAEYIINEENLQEIIRYLKQIPYKSLDLSAQLNCDYFKANTTTLIFDNEIIYDIITSKSSITPVDKFRLIIFSFGIYKKIGIKIEKCKIYNTLLGDEYSMVLENLDFKLFEKVLKHDVELSSQLWELMNDQQTLYMSLFSIKDDKK